MNPVAKRTFTGLAVGAAVIAAILLARPAALKCALSAIACLATLELVMLLAKKAHERPSAMRWLWCALVFLVGEAVIAFGLWGLAETALRHGNVMLLYVVAIVKFSDVGGFAFGLSSARMLKGGNHKMCPTISPGKSWEGLLGSFVFSCAVSCAFMPATHFPAGKALAFGVAAAILGTAGDLVESKFKRWVGVKDSSTLRITNGLGGILDMIDSLLIAPPLLLLAI